MLCLLNNTINKAGPGFVAPWILFSFLVRCHIKGLWKTSPGSESGGQIDFITTFINDMLNAPSCLSKLLAHSSDTQAYPTRHATRGLFTVPKSRTDYGRHTVLHREKTTWNSIQHRVTRASSNIRFKKTKQIRIHPMGTVMQYKHRTHAYKHT